MKAPLPPGSLYLFAFDIAQWADDLERLNQAFDDEPGIIAWWNHIPGSYIFRAEPGNVELLKRLRTFAGRRKTLAFEVGRPEEIVGVLSMPAWLWFYDIPEEEKQDLISSAEKKTKRTKRALIEQKDD